MHLGSTVPAGLCWMRLTQGGPSLPARGVVVRQAQDHAHPAFPGLLGKTCWISHGPLALKELGLRGIRRGSGARAGGTRWVLDGARSSIMG